MPWIQDEDHNQRYQFEPLDQTRTMLLDVGDGSLIEVGNTAVLRYPAAHVDDVVKLIVNDAGQSWTRENPELDTMSTEEIWEFMDQVSDPDHPFWTHPDVIKNP